VCPSSVIPSLEQNCASEKSCNDCTYHVKKKVTLSVRIPN
jgi:hypothetical protein